MNRPIVVFNVHANDGVYQVEVTQRKAAHMDGLIELIQDSLGIDDITEDMIQVHETIDCLWLDEESDISQLLELLELSDEDYLLVEAAYDADIVGPRAGHADVSDAVAHANDSLIGKYDSFADYSREMARGMFDELALRYLDYEKWENDLNHDVCTGDDSDGDTYIFTA